MNHIGQLIVEGRVELGMSSRQLAAQLGVSTTFVRDFEKGSCPFPESRVLDLPEPIRQRVAEAFVEQHQRAIARLRDG